MDIEAAPGPSCIVQVYDEPAGSPAALGLVDPPAITEAVVEEERGITYLLLTAWLQFLPLSWGKLLYSFIFPSPTGVCGCHACLGHTVPGNYLPAAEVEHGGSHREEPGP